MELGHGGELGPLAPLRISLLAQVVGPQSCDERLRGLLHQLDYGLVQRVLVLVQPANHSVADLEMEEGGEGGGGGGGGGNGGREEEL